MLGICGGFQMLGRTIRDPVGVEGVPGAEAPGLGLLEATTTFGTEKVLRLHGSGGYEIHHGRVEHAYEELPHGRVTDGVVSGTMWHGALESDELRHAFLAEVAELVGQDPIPSGTSFAVARARRLDLLGDLAEEHLDLDALLALALQGAPPVPLLPR